MSDGSDDRIPLPCFREQFAVQCDVVEDEPVDKLETDPMQESYAPMDHRRTSCCDTEPSQSLISCPSSKLRPTIVPSVRFHISSF